MRLNFVFRQVSCWSSLSLLARLRHPVNGNAWQSFLWQAQRVSRRFKYISSLYVYKQCSCDLHTIFVVGHMVTPRYANYTACEGTSGGTHPTSDGYWQCFSVFHRSFLPYNVLGNFPTWPSTCHTSPLVTDNVPPVFAVISYGPLRTSNMSEMCDLRGLRHCFTLGLGFALISLPWDADHLCG